jgi:hypothetical protein
MKTALGVICGVALFVAAIVGINALGFGLFSFLAPKYEAVRRDQMIESRSYSEGTIRELYTIQRQYRTAKTDAEKDTLAAAARHEFSIFPQDRLPSDLRAFMAQVGG